MPKNEGKDSSLKIPAIIAAAAISAAITIFLVREYAARSLFPLVVLGTAFPPLISDASIARNLDSGDNYLVYSSIGMLEERNSHLATDKARQLMYGKEGWVHGALYLGHFGDLSAIPYLIKSLRHHFASGLYKEMGEKLENLTGEHYGTDFQKWSAWWQQTHPEAHFDFDSNLDT